MTVLVAPEMWFMQGPATDVESAKLRTSAAAFRRVLDAQCGFKQGVVYSKSVCDDLKVSATGADVNVSVRPGACFVRGTQAATQGMYHIYNDAALVINDTGTNPPHATLDRIDLVVARMQDQFYSGGVDLPTIELVIGTPAASPAVPAAPANTQILAQILIKNLTAQPNGFVLNANITDRRSPFGAGPVLLDDILVGTDARYPAATALLTFLNTTGGVANLIPPGFRRLRAQWVARGDAASVAPTLGARLNNDATAVYDQSWNRTNAVATVTESLALTYAQVGRGTGATATANYSGIGEFSIHNPGAGPFNKVVEARYASGFLDTTANQEWGAIAAKYRTTGIPITRLDMLFTAGNIGAGSQFELWGDGPYQP